MKTKTREFSFWNGWSQVRMRDRAKIQAEIMKNLGISSRMAWNQRRIGLVEPKVSEARAIEAAFAKVGIKDVWGAAQ